MLDSAGFQGLGSGLRARDMSPDSAIFTAESSNFSLFSSASASVDRCSLASDLPDQDSAVSHLAGHELSEVLSGPGSSPNKHTPVPMNSLSKKVKTKVQKVESSEAETTEDESTAIGSARSSFSQALKECQDRKLRSEALMKKKFNRQRPASVDLNIPVNNLINSSSPRLGTMKKQPAAPCKTSAFPSPGTPNNWQPNVRIQKGWSSERVPLHSNVNRRNINAPMLSYNNNGRTLPSKWEDAERWIFSPVPVDGAFRTGLVQQAESKPKSKSGPLGPPGLAYYQMFTPAGPTLEIGRREKGKLAESSPFFLGNEHCMARSISINGCSELVAKSSFVVHHPDEINGVTQEDNAANNISRVLSRRDMATQMSPDSSSIQSSQRRSSSYSEATLPVFEIVREEAKITAWENLQKAKAETAIRKLEMKLEKKRRAGQSIILPEDSAHWFIEWMLYLSCVLMHRIYFLVVRWAFAVVRHAWSAKSDHMNNCLWTTGNEVNWVFLEVFSA
ncbi:Remorin family protein [Striga hermonthica]|uniref:Remorin family protein n=1 Tax=Striga hermonthica TaxID=68872 RepID=A0A9N7N1N1_STRHE|nr:Remorin family protein [Striga hermonthica]